MRGFLNFSRNKLPKRAFRARLPQLFKEQASKTSISCKASSTFQARSFQSLAPATQNAKMTSHLESLKRQNEHFVRDFLNFSPQLASKMIISCKASSTFQGTSFQNEHFVRGFLNFSRNKLPKRAFRARLPQLFKEQASKTSISCKASSTFQARSFQSLAPATQNAKMTSHLESLKRQNEHFVRDFLQIPHLQLENRRFRASFSYKAIFTELKKYDFCEASATFQDTHEMLRLPRYLKECHVCASLPMRFVEVAPSPRHKMMRLPRHRERPHHIVLRLPRKNDALALTCFQSIAPVTQNTKTTSHFVTWERQKEHFVRDFFHFSHFEGKDCVAVRMYRPIERN